MAKVNDTDKMLDELVKGKQPEELLGEGGVLKQLTKRLVERALEGEQYGPERTAASATL